jgi:hypothetical protein
MDEYLSTKGSEEATNKVQYVLNYNTYDDQVTAQRAPVLAAIQSQLESWKGSDDGNQYLATTLNGLSFKYTSQINDAYAADQAGTDTSNLTVPLGNAWCNNYLTSQGRANCFADVADLQKMVDNSLSFLAVKQASLGVNAPYTPPTKGLLQALVVQAHAARAAKKGTHASSIVLAKSKTVSLAAGRTKKVSMPIPKVVRSEFKHLWNKGVRTLHANLVVNLTLTNGDFTTRTIPVKIHLAKSKKRHRS